MLTAERWLAQGERFGGEAQFADRRRIRRHTLIAAALWVLLVVIVAGWYSSRLIDGQIDEATTDAARETQHAALDLDRMFVEMAGVARIVARQTAVHELIARYDRDAEAMSKLPAAERRDLLGADPKARELGSSFDAIATDLGYSRVLLFDAAGLERRGPAAGAAPAARWASRTPAATTSARRCEPVRARCSRPAARPARQGSPSPAGSTRAARRSAWSSSSRMPRRSRRCSPATGLRMVVDAAGRVVAASQPDLVLRHVGPLSRRRPEPRTPSGSVGFQALDSRPVLATQSALAHASYHVVTMTPLDWVAPAQHMHDGVAALVALLGLLLVALADRQTDAAGAAAPHRTAPGQAGLAVPAIDDRPTPRSGLLQGPRLALPRLQQGLRGNLRRQARGDRGQASSPSCPTRRPRSSITSRPSSAAC